MTRYRALGWPTVILASMVAVWGEMASGAHSPLRPFIAFWFLLVCPGMAYLPLLHLRDAAIEFVLGIALSIAICAVVSELLVLASSWNPEMALLIVSAFAAVGGAMQVRRYWQTAQQRGKPI
ncbi:MAG: hypothetical protein PHQ40_14595 [Anaerolineaceae bacterium]|nr:hypothetical protein [Anaerolineaceae bacterium]